LVDLWQKHCVPNGVEVLFSKSDKKKFQLYDWSQDLEEASVEQDHLKYAAHDSYFLPYIASKLEITKEQHLNF
jgi:hypothetical protein